MAAASTGLKVCLLGEGRVGKTSILLKFVKDEFDDKQASSMDASYMEKVVSVDGTDHKLSIWDTAGQERFHALTPLYYRDATGALLVYDITDSHSFERVKAWVKELRKVVGPSISLAIAGNKCDLESKRHVPADVAQAYADEVGALHVLTS
ncbi:RAB21, partial [Symbiodinium sp. KB8]